MARTASILATGGGADGGGDGGADGGAAGGDGGGVVFLAGQVRISTVLDLDWHLSSGCFLYRGSNINIIILLLSKPK